MNFVTVLDFVGPFVGLLFLLFARRYWVHGEVARRAAQRDRGVRAELADKLKSGRWVWMGSLTGKNTLIGIEPPCDGSPLCAGAIHLHRPESGTELELHMTDHELHQVQLLIGECRRLKAEQVAA